MSTHKIIRIPQASGAIRLVALSADDAEAVHLDRAMIDAVTPLGCVDVFRNGAREWGNTGPRWRDIPEDVLASLEYAARQ